MFWGCHVVPTGGIVGRGRARADGKECESASRRS
jgi:hypothetical protein